MLSLGCCYRDGHGVDLDHQQAFYWFKKGAFSPSLSQPFHISLSVKASKSYCFSVKTMPLADSDSDTDWNAQAKILPVRSSSSTPPPHSPHNTSYARNSSQKNFHSKTDHCTRKTQKNHHYVPCVLLRGKAAGPSGISFDLLKIACSSAPEIADDLAHYFQQLIVLKNNPPFELLAARLIALVKPGNGINPDGIRPIAVGESLSR
ncbi:hypothetical protein P9112_006216 [Eukaryota sp. TZLM1-RC]